MPWQFFPTGAAITQGAASPPFHGFFDPMGWGIEFIYTAIIVFFCFLIYYMTRDMYKLTKHEGIHLFRNTFLFFGLAYIFRLVLNLILLGDITFDFIQSPREIMPAFMVVTTFFSTMAIFFLTYSTLWKRIKSKYLILISYLIVAIISILPFFTRSHYIVVLLQLLLLIFAVIMIYIRKARHIKIRVLYLLILVFWLLNFFFVGRRGFLPFEIKLLFQIASIGVFYLIYRKVSKWTK